LLDAVAPAVLSRKDRWFRWKCAGDSARYRSKHWLARVPQFSWYRGETCWLT